MALALAAAACGGAAPGREAAGPAGPVATAVLAPGVSPSGPTPVAIPAGSAQVLFALTGLPATAEAHDLVAEIERIGDDRIKRWPVDAPASANDPPSVIVPPYEVTPGEYRLTVWAGDAAVVQRYAFRVTPP